ncbi:MAG: DMT family transporter [Alphaproteobacteria bacterium]
MERKDSLDTLGILFLIWFSAMLGLNQVLVKLVNETLQPVFQAGLRSALAFIPVFAWALYRRKKLSITDGTLGVGIFLGFLFGCEFILLFYSVEYTTVSRVSIFFYTMPIWLAIVAHFVLPNEKLSLIRSIGLALAIGGIVLALSDKTPDPNHTKGMIGDLMALSASFLWLGIALMARKSSIQKCSAEMAMLYQLGVSAILLLPLAFMIGDLVVGPMTAKFFSIYFVQIFVIVAFGFLVWFWILTIYPASDMAAFSFLSPVFGVIFGWLFLNESISARTLIALILVAFGIYFVNQKAKNTTTSS